MPGGAERGEGVPTGAALPRAEVRETHSAVILLIGDRAYKVKKPVDLGFLDFSTPELRAQACRRELAVNRRIAPDVYLGVATMRPERDLDADLGPDLDADPQASAEPPACEHVLVMRRMPDDRRLAALVQDGVDVRDDLRRLARLVAAFHAAAVTDADIAAAGSSEALEGRWRRNVAVLQRFAQGGPLQDKVGEAERLALEYVAGRHPLLTARMAAGWVRDGHGDLLADDIFCLPDGPRVLDALDFDDRLRWLDVLDDVACLAMDLERLGSAALGRAFLRDYVEFSGAPHPESLVHHYLAYRAVMRAMVTAIRTEQDGSSPAPVEQLLDIGLDHLRQGRVRLVVVGGGPASGKTTTATALADRLDLAVVSSDRVRKEMLGLDPETHRPSAFGAGIYRPEVTERTYALMADRARAILSMGRSVVVDGTFAADRHRRLMAGVAADTRTAVSWVRCLPPDAVVEARLQNRRRHPDAVTDADAVVAASLTRVTDPWPGVVDLDTSRAVDDLVDTVCASW